MGAVEEKNTYEKLAQFAMNNPRYSFRCTISNIAKLIKKQWGKVVEDLIFEKPRRKSSAQSKKSVDNSSDGVSAPGFRGRINSMDD